jgi:hypothetical protein
MSRIEKEFLAEECGVDECEVYNSYPAVEDIRYYLVKKHLFLKMKKTKPLPKINKRFLSLSKEDIKLPKDFDYSYSKEIKKNDKFFQGCFDFNTDIGA